VTSFQLGQAFGKAIMEIDQPMGLGRLIRGDLMTAALAEEGDHQLGDHLLDVGLGWQIAVILEQIGAQLFAQDGHHLVLEHPRKPLWAVPVGLHLFPDIGDEVTQGADQLNAAVTPDFQKPGTALLVQHHPFMEKGAPDGGQMGREGWRRESGFRVYTAIVITFCHGQAPNNKKPDRHRAGRALVEGNE